VKESKIIPVWYKKGPATVCLLLTNSGKAIARGVAICSELDEYDGYVGRMKAYGRAMQARCHRKNVAPVRDLESGKYIPEHVAEYANKDYSFFFNTAYKGFYCPKLTKEKRILLTFDK
jgi:hypothetical protein